MSQKAESISKIELIRKEIPLTRWNLLDPTQQATLRAMGLVPAKPKKKTRLTSLQKKAVASLKEYYLVAAIDCRLCGHTSVESYKMTQQNYLPNSPGEPFLKAKPVEFNEAVENGYKSETHSRPYCVCCKEKLAEKSKEELIKLVINFAKYDTARR